MRPTKEIIEPHWNDIFDRDRAIMSLQNENECFVAMKEGVGVRIADLEAENERLRRYITSARDLLETHPMPSDAYRVLSEAINAEGGDDE